MFSYSLGFDSLKKKNLIPPINLLFAMIPPCRNYNCNRYSTADKPDATKIWSMNNRLQLALH